MSALAAPPKANGNKPSNPPNQALYLSHLNDRIPKDDLKRALYGLCSTYGPVLDIVALKTMKMRGQAHVVYRDVQTSTQAMRALQGYEFFGKPIRISYGKGKASVVSRLDGTAKMPEATQAPAQMSDTARSIFAAPPGTSAAGLPPTAPPPGIASNALPTKPSVGDADAAPQGVKRPREDDEPEAEEAGDAPMDEDDDEGGAMEMEESDED